MFISQELRKKSIAEYLLYMWQVEDIIRAYDCSLSRIRREYISRFDYDDEQLEEMTGSEYKSFDLEEIRSNYKMLTQEDTSYIENLFETVGNDDIFNDFPEND